MHAPGHLAVQLLSCIGHIMQSKGFVNFLWLCALACSKHAPSTATLFFHVGINTTGLVPRFLWSQPSHNINNIMHNTHSLWWSLKKNMREEAGQVATTPSLMASGFMMDYGHLRLH